MNRKLAVLTLLIGEVAGLAAAVACTRQLLHAPRFGQPRPDAWLLVAAAGVAVALSCWLLAGTVLSCARRLVPALRPLARLDALTALPLRALLDAALVVALSAPLPAAPAAPASQAPRRHAITRVVVGASPAPHAPRPTIASPASTTAPPPTPAPGPRGGTATGTHVVRAGENLWLIARDELAHRNGTAPTERETAHYWSRVISANRARLRSGNPSLIFPGEVVALPA